MTYMIMVEGEDRLCLWMHDARMVSPVVFCADCSMENRGKTS